MKSNTLMATLWLPLLCLFSNSLSGQEFATFHAKKRSESLESGQLSQCFKKYALFQIESNRLNDHIQSAEQVQFSIAFEAGIQIDFSLEKNELRSEGYRLIYSLEDTTIELPRSPCITFKGITTDGGKVRATIKDGFLTFMIKYAHSCLFLENATRFDPSLPKDTYVLYHAEDSKPLPTNFCAYTEVKSRKKALIENNQGRSVLPKGCTKVRLAIASDYLMYQQYGNDTEAHNLTVINNVASDFDDAFEYKVEFTVVEQFVSTTASNSAESTWSSSTSPQTVLGNFRAWGILGGFTNTFDIGQFWTRRDFQGTTVGLAYRGGICSIHKYHILQDYTSDADSKRVLTSHEIGHNWGCVHDVQGSNFIMSPQVNSTTVWSSASIDSLNVRNASVECNQLGGAPVAYFHINPTECLNTPIQILDLSMRNPAEWQWDFPTANPDTSDNQHNTIQYSSYGNKSITLTASNNECAGPSAGVLVRTFEVSNQEGPPPSCPIGLTNQSTQSNYQTGIHSLQFDSLFSTSGSTYSDGSVYFNRTCSNYINLDPGTYSFSVRVGNINQEHIDVYIDYNNDGDFDEPNELVVDDAQTSNSLFSTTIQIPNSGVVMDTLLRMRVMTDFNPISDACQTPSYGQVEDFGLLIIAPSVPNCAQMVENLKSIVQDSTTVIIGWDANQSTVRHRLEFREIGMSNWTTSQIISGYPRNSFTIRNLQPNKTYEFRLRQECSTLAGPYTPIQFFHTYTSSNCDRPQNLHAANNPNNTSQIRVYCDYEPDAVNGLQQLRYRLANQTQWERKNSKKSLFILNNLLPSSTYEYRVRTKCASGWSSWSTIRTVTTLANPNPVLISPSLQRSSEDGKFQEEGLVFPNPFYDNLHVAVPDRIVEGFLIIYDVKGALLEKRTFMKEQTIMLQTKDLPSGQYLIRIVSPMEKPILMWATKR